MSLLQKKRNGPIRGLMKKSSYAYVNARVRARRAKLLPRDTYPKLLKMGIPEITRFIEDTEYGREIDEMAARFAGIDLLENALNVNEERNYAEIRDLAKGEAGVLVERYLERFTVWNLKTILRGRFWGASPEQIQKELLIETRDDYEFYRSLMEAEGPGVGPAIEALANHPNGAAAARVLRQAESGPGDDGVTLQRYEDALDRAYYTRLLETISGTDPDTRLFLKFIRKEIDALNLSLILRFEWRDDPSTAVLSHTIPGGLELGPDELRRLAEASNRAELIERLKEFKIHDALKDSLEEAQRRNSLVPVQLALTRTVADFAQRFSFHNPLSVLPIINFLMRKNLEVRNLRAIARGKQAGLDESQLEPLVVVI